MTLLEVSYITNWKGNAIPAVRTSF